MADGEASELRPASFRRKPRMEILAFGSSTGGPNALIAVFSKLAGKIELPIVLTQHMPPTFTPILAESLTRTTGITAVQAENYMPLLPGRIHLAPGDRHLVLVRRAGEIVCRLNDGPAENFCKPSVDPMLRSVASHFGSTALAIILTGMGKDGLKGCQSLVDAGGQVLAQDQSTSAVWGMPRAVAEAGLCKAALPLSLLPEAILKIAEGRG